MTETPKERALPSLVADDLVDLAREVAGRHLLDERSTDGRPYEGTNGLAIAYPYAILELLVEIRDAVSDPRSRLAAGEAVFDRRPVLAPRLGEKDLDVLGDRILSAVNGVGWLDPVRAVNVAAAVDQAVVTFLREKGIAS